MRKTELQKELERFRMELRQAAFEEETRFTKLHEERSTVIAEIHKRLIQMHANLRELKSTVELDFLEESKEEKDQKANETNESINSLWCYFVENRIYLPDNLCEKIERLHTQSLQLYIELLISHLTIRSSENKLDSAENDQHLSNASDILSNKISPTLQDIESEIRFLLGSSTNSQHN